MFYWDGLLRFRWVDPGGDRQLRGSRRDTLEAVGVRQEGRIEGDRALCGELGGTAVMNGLRRHQADAGVAMSRVVPGEERVTVSTRILDATEAIREVGAVFERFELRLGVRVVIGDMRPAVGRAAINAHHPAGTRNAQPRRQNVHAVHQDLSIRVVRRLQSK